MKRLIYLAIIGSLVALSACSDKDDEPRYDGGTDAVVPVKMLDPIAGCLSGVFSVSATERVHFSKGQSAVPGEYEHVAVCNQPI